MADARSIMDLANAPWTDLLDTLPKGNHSLVAYRTKKLIAPDGHRVGLINLDGEHPPHFHTKASTLFILEGSIRLRGRDAGRGNWVLEPYGAIHARTRSNNVTYGLGMSDGDFGVGNVMLKDVNDIPGWVKDLGFKIDEWANVVDSATLEWQAFGPGLSMKVLHKFDGRPAFAALVKADAGAALPRRRYLGPADMYVLSGRMQFKDGVAEAGWWVHEPAGASDDIVTFPVATEFLANTYGTILEFDAAGGLARAIEGYSIRDMLGSPAPQPA